MTKYIVGGVSEFKVDNVSTAATSLTNQSGFMESIDGLGVEVMPLDCTTFADVGERVTPGIQASQEWSVSGFWDNAGTGPDEVYSTMAGTITAFEYFPQGTASSRRKYSGNAMVTSFRITGAVKELIKYEARFKLDGTMTSATV